MTHDVVVAQPDTPFKDLVELLESNRVSALPVLDAERRVVGVVSEADLILKEELPPDERHHRRIGWQPSFERRRRAEAGSAGELMTTPAVTITADASLTRAAKLMHERDVKRLPVVDDRGGLIGIVSRKDLLRIFLRSDDEIRSEIVEEVLRRRLWLTPDEGQIVVTVEDGVARLDGWIDRKSTRDILDALVLGVDGVVMVDDRVAYRTDDTHIRPEAPLPWGVLPHAARYP